MRIFAPSHLLQSYPLREALREIAVLGFAGSEIWHEHLEEAPPSVKTIKSFPLAYSFHAPSWDINPTSRLKAVRDFSVNLILESLNFAASIEAEVVVVHPGFKSNPKDDFKVYEDFLEDFLSRLTIRGKELGLVIAAEIMDATPNQLVNTPQVANYLTSAIPGLTICFDVAHAGRFSEPLKSLGQIDKVSHFHLSNTTAEIPHTALADGHLDIGEILAAIESRYPQAIITNEGFDPSDELGLVKRNKAYLKSTGFWRENTPDKLIPPAPAV